MDGISIGKTNYKQSVRNALAEEQNKTDKKSKPKKSYDTSIKDVRAISRVVLPKDVNISELTESYAQFLNKVTLNIVNSNLNEAHFSIRIPLLNRQLLILEKDTKASDQNRVLYRIIGGDFALASNGGNARLEFRRILNSNECIIALQEYEPTLPWWVYKYTQAKLHKTVMNSFKLYLNLKSQNNKGSLNVKKFILPLIITCGVVTKLYGLKKYLARNNNMSNAELL